MSSKWNEFLKFLSQSNRELAGRLRQGQLSNFKDNKLELHFSGLFSKQMEFVNEETNRQSIEASLEEFFECPLLLSILLEQKFKNQEVSLDSDLEEPVIKEQYLSDPTAMIVQKVFNVTIRNVFQEPPQVQYHLGKSCNFKKD